MDKKFQFHPEWLKEKVENCPQPDDLVFNGGEMFLGEAPEQPDCVHNFITDSRGSFCLKCGIKEITYWIRCTNAAEEILVELQKENEKLKENQIPEAMFYGIDFAVYDGGLSEKQARFLANMGPNRWLFLPKDQTPENSFEKLMEKLRESQDEVQQKTSPNT